MTDEHAGKSVFLISPIGEEGSEIRKKADQVQKHIVKKALEPLGMTVERADDNKNPGAITPAIVASIMSADLVVADLSGFNPNVFYEVAVAHGMRVPVVHIQTRDDPPAFDLKDIRTIKYDIGDPDSVERSQRQVADYAQAALKNPDSIETPLRAAGRFRAVQESSDPEVISLDAIHQTLEKMSAKLEALQPTPARPAYGSAVPLDSGYVNSSDLADLRRLFDESRISPPDYGEIAGTITAHNEAARQLASELAKSAVHSRDESRGDDAFANEDEHENEDEGFQA